MAERKSITQPYYSNCLIEAIKAKLKDWKHVKIICIPPKYNEVFCFHFMWTNGVNDYDFGAQGISYWWQEYFFKGTIRQYKLGWASKYLAYRKHLYYQKQEQIKDLKKEKII